jgi:hypothetical protein
MTIKECQHETHKHIKQVEHFIGIIIDELESRAEKHDGSKLISPEVEIFTEYTPKLAKSTYCSDEYKANLKEMDVAIKHHYANNRHHPEHFENGIEDMNLVDLIEMFCDWKAATLRHSDGNLSKSIEINAERFNYDEQIKKIFLNTTKLFEECKQNV